MRLRAVVPSMIVTLAATCGCVPRADATADATTPTSVYSAGVVESARVVALVPFFEALDRANTEAYLTAMRDQALTEARAAALRARGAQASSSHSTPAEGHTDEWWHGVAQCEQGGRNDEYFGYFSFMDGSQGGKPWDEQVAAGNALLARAGREVGPWAASCVASGYRASPGG